MEFVVCCCWRRLWKGYCKFNLSYSLLNEIIMGKPWTLRVKPVLNDRSIINKRKNNAHAKIAREVINEKDSKLEAAVEWCLSNNRRGWAALKTNDFPLLKDARAINRRLDGLVTNKAEYESRSILTNNEEQTLVGYMKNMNRCNQGVSRSDTTVVILKMLEIRKWGFRKYGARRYNPLSKAANDALENKNVSRFGEDLIPNIEI